MERKDAKPACGREGELGPALPRVNNSTRLYLDSRSPAGRGGILGAPDPASGATQRVFVVVVPLHSVLVNGLDFTGREKRGGLGCFRKAQVCGEEGAVVAWGGESPANRLRFQSPFLTPLCLPA